MIRYGARAVPWLLVLASCLLVGALMALVTRWPWAWALHGTSLGLMAAAVAWSMDERCATIVDTLPRGFRWRTGVRAFVIPVVLTVWAVSVVRLSAEVPDHADLFALQGFAAVAVALAFTVWRRSQGSAEPGASFATVVIPTTTAVALSGSLLERVPLFPLQPQDDWALSWVIWSALTAGSIAVVVLVLAPVTVTQRRLVR